MTLQIGRFAVTSVSILALISPCAARAEANDGNLRAGPGSPVTVFGPKGFQRTAGHPDVFHEEFAATETTGQLELFNGGPSSGSRVTGAWVVLNGKQILGPDDFKKADALLQTPVTLKAENTLEITLASRPGTYLVARVTQAFLFEDDTSGVIKADLAVTDLVITPDRCDPQTPVSAQATVTNWGRRNSGPATLVFTMDGSEIGQVAVSSLQVGASASFSIDLAAHGPGRHQLWASVEAGAGMIDPSPGNNSRMATLRVSGESPPVPELEFGPPQFPPSQGAPATITINVRNPSFADLSQIWLWLSVAGPSLAPQAPQHSAADLLTPNQQFGAPNSDLICDVCPPLPAPDFVIASLPAGESTEVQFEWVYDTAGQYLVGVTAGNLPALFPVEELTASWDLVFAGPALQTVLNQPKWSSMGPYQITNEYPSGPNTGRISSLAIHPQNPKTIYAADASLGLQISGTGLWKTTDGGQSWNPLGDKFPQMNIMTIALDPTNPDIVYCAGGVWRFDTPKPLAPGLPDQITGYIFKSIDGGQNWSAFGHPADGYSKLVVRRLAGSPKVVIYAASNRGVLRYTSDDPVALSSQASEWTVILDGKISDVVVHPTDPNVVFAVRNISTGQYYFQLDGLYRTKSGLFATGKDDWSLRLGFSVPKPDRQMFVDLFHANPQKVYLLAGSPKDGFDLRISENQGDGFFDVVHSLPPKCDSSVPPNCSPGSYLRAHPTIENLVYAGYDQPPFPNLLRMRSVNGTWYSTVIPDLHPDQHIMEFFPDSNSFSGWGYVLGNDGGVYRGEYEWEFGFDRVIPINDGLVSAEFYESGFDVSPINPDVMIGGTQDNGVILYQPNSNPYGKWIYRATGDGTAAVIAPSDPKTMYAKNTDGLHSGIIRSTDGGGVKWQGTEHIGVVDGGGPIFTDPGSADAIYVGGPQVQLSINGGDNWSQIGPSDPQKKGDVIQVLRTTGASEGPVLYAGTANHGQLWAQIPGPIPQWPLAWQLVDEHPDPYAYVQSMALAASNGDVLFVVYGNCTKDKRLRRFQFTWGSGWSGEWITGNLPEIHATTNTKAEVYTIATHPSDESTVFVGTDKGVYRVYRGMSSGNSWIWLPYNNGLPLVLISKLISIPLTGEVRASTVGRGVWSIKPFTICTHCGG